MTFDACMIMYIIYIEYSILRVFALSVSVFNCFIHILNFGLASQLKSDFTLILKILKIKIILNYTKFQIL